MRNAHRAPDAYKAPIHPARSQAGIALISTLFVAATLLILGAGALHLAQIDLTIGDNVRANALAKHRAELALEASLIALQRELETSGAFPATFSLPTLELVDSPSGPLAAAPTNFYEWRSPGEVVLRVEGLGPREASFSSEAVLGLGSVPTLSPTGLSAGGAVVIRNWPDTLLLGAALHGDSGYEFDPLDSSRFADCSSRDASGRCTLWLPRDMSLDLNADGVPDALKVSAAAGMTSYRCDPAGNADLCELASGQTLPRLRTPTPVVSPFDTSGLMGSQLTACDVNYALPPTLNSQADLGAAGFVPGATVCVSGGDLSFPSGAILDGVNIVVEDGDVHFGGGTLTEVRLIAKNGLLDLNGVRADSSFLYGDRDMTVDGSTELLGNSTLVSGGDLEFAGVTSATLGVNGPEVGVSVYAGGDLRYRATADSFARFKAGGDFLTESTACILGSVEAVMDLRAEDGICIDSGLLTANAAPSAPTLRVASRR